MMAEETENLVDLAAILAKAKARMSDLAQFDMTEDGIALAFTAKHKDELRFDHTRGKWFRWTGVYWEVEETKLAFSWARQESRAFLRQLQAEGKQGPPQLGKAATAAGAERFAQADRAFAVTSAIWDQDPWLLGTLGGTVDLRTGTIREARQEDHITRITAVAPADVPEHPVWDQFLHDATAGDRGLIRFLRQWCGYMLTGDTREHALLFIYGPGGNGKSVFLNTIAGIMAAYARNSPMDTFTSSSGDKHPTDIAMLKGARMVSATETEEGRAWAEVRIKQLTGGDMISARFMRQDFFEFRPEFKLVVAGNHKPVLRNVDAAAKRRFNVVPFIHVPPNPNRELEQSLQAEWPAILRWMIEGCQDWQLHGLVRPQVVLDATAEYFSEQDSVAQWIEDNCIVGKANTDTAKALYSDWSKYADSIGEKPGTSKWFGQVLLRRGFTQMRDRKTGRGYQGLAVIRQMDEGTRRYGDE